MAISFPSSKSTGQKFTHGNKAWTWDGNSWKGGVTAGSDAGTLDSLNSTQFLRSDTDTSTTGKLGISTGSPFSKLQVGGHTFSGGNGMYADSRVGISNHGELTGLMLASTYNDTVHPEYGLVFVQGPDTSSYNVWSISPDGPAKGDSLSFHYQSGSTNIHSPSNAKVTFDGNGNVGIGRTSPQSKLDVLSSARVTSAANTSHSLKLEARSDFANDASSALIWVSDGGASSNPMFTSAGAHLVIEGRKSNARHIYFKVGDTTAAQHVMLANGNVGIGTSSPATTLHLFNSSQARFSMQNSARRFDLMTDGDGFTIRDQSAALSRLTIDTTGKVGVNNVSPQGVLSIHGGSGTSYSEVETLNGVNFYKFFKVIDTARSLQMENIFVMPNLSNGQKYIHFITTMQGAMGFDLDILCGRSGSERMFGRVSLRGFKYHESDGDYRHGAIESASSINAYGNYFEINGPITQYLADSANATQESYSNPGNYWVTRIPCNFVGGGSGQIEFTAFLKTMHHNTGPGGTYYIGIV